MTSWLRLPRSRIIEAIAILMIVGCGGGSGFVRIDDESRMQLSTNGKATGPYVRATIDLHNRDVLTSPPYTNGRNKKLSHLYITASFMEAGATAKHTVPLYLVDFEKNSVDESRGMELVSNYALDPTRSGQAILDIETRALHKNTADQAIEFWRQTKDLAKAALGVVGKPADSVLGAVDITASALSKYAAQEGHYSVDVAVPRTIPSSPYAAVFLLVATGQNGMPLEVEAKVRRYRGSKPTLCTEGEVAYLCDANKIPYRELPYILVVFSTTDFVVHADMLNIKAGCGGLTEGDISKSRTLADTRLLVAKQRDLESHLAEKASVLLRFQAAVRDGLLPQAIDIYDQGLANELPPGSEQTESYKQHYAAQLDRLEKCTAAIKRRIPYFDVVDALVASLKDSLPANAPESILEKLLVDIASFVHIAARRESALSGTRVFQAAEARKNAINALLYDRHYAASLRRLAAATSRTADWDLFARELEARYAVTACELCRDAARGAVVRYWNLSGGDANPEGSSTRADALAAASEVLTKARVELVARDRVRESPESLPSAVQALEDDIQAVQATPPQDRGANIRALSNLTQEVQSTQSLLGEH